MPQFQTIEQAFEWFLENVFPILPTPDKRKLKNVKYDFYKEGLKVSHKRMVRVMNEYAKFGTFYTLELDEGEEGNIANKES